MTLSGSDKANDLLSSHIDSLICLLYEMKVNDREGFQTLPFKFHPLSCLQKKANGWKIEYEMAGMTVLTTFLDPITTNSTAYNTTTISQMQMT